MSIDTELSPAIQAFLLRDYIKCSNLAGPIMDKNTTLESVFLVVASYMRVRNAQDAENVALPYFSRLSDKWDQRMAALSFGRAKFDEIAAEAQDDKRRLQFLFYMGALQVSQRQHKAARETFQKFLVSGIEPVPCMELYLLGIENNYLTTGASGTDIDKPVIELNEKASKLFQAGQKDQALEVAKQALVAAKTTLGDLHPALINAVNNLGLIQLTAGMGIQARPILEEHTRLMLMAAGPDDPAYALSLENLAMGIIKGRQMGEMLDLGRAESLAKVALSIRQRSGQGEEELAQAKAIIAAVSQANEQLKKPAPAAPVAEKKPGGWARWFGRKPKAEEMRESYGFQPEDPILCHDPLGERQFILSLRCPKGHRLRGSRSGSGDGKCTHPDSHQSPFGPPGESCIVDRYEVTCDGGEYSGVLFFDMYHPDPPPQFAPRGLTRIQTAKAAHPAGE